MFDFIRRLKPAYSFYNFFHRNQLAHNTAIYKSLGIGKKYYSPVSASDFAKAGLKTSPLEPDPHALDRSHVFNGLLPADQHSLRDFDKNGFAIWRNFISGEQADDIDSEITRFLKDGTIKFKYGNKIMFAIHQSLQLRNIGMRKDLIEILSALMGREAVLFQSINFINGSEQRTHSDSIHMTTYPLGGLIACWLALEDIGPDQGPLHYYPGSHRLPYYLNSDYDNEGSALLTGSKTYGEYEDFIAGKIREQTLQKQIFTAKKGDLLIWHANLFHGGEPHIDKSKSRKSVVFHYFAKDVVCYHEITQRPALIQKFA
jgi:phytanoyl-CoA hydroxylase